MNGVERPGASTTRTFTDTSDVIKEEIIEHSEENFQILIKEVKTWYATIERDSTWYQDEKFTSLTNGGEEVEIVDEDSPIEIPGGNHSYTYTKTGNPEIMDLSEVSVGEPGNPEKELRMHQFNYTVKKHTYGRSGSEWRGTEEDYNLYDFTNMHVQSNNNKKYTIITKEEDRYIVGPQRVTENPNSFLALLSNATGTYTAGATFVPKSAGGKVVQYPDLYKGDAGAGELLENGAQMLFELIEETSQCKELADVMRWLLYLYTGNNYGVTSLDISMFNLEGIEIGATIIGNTVEEKVWCSLINAGYSEYAVAGVMGNIYAESGFSSLNGNTHDPIMGAVTKIGLCSWRDQRKAQLEEYAKAKDVACWHENTQIEFLIGELTEGGGCSGCADYQLKTTANGSTIYRAEDFISATNVADATEAFYYMFIEKSTDRLGSSGTTVGIDERVEKAEEYYGIYAGKTIEEIAGVNEKQVAIANIAQNSEDYGIVPRDGYCLGWVADVYAAAGAPVESANCAYCAGNRYSVSQDLTNIPLGAAVYGESSSRNGVLYGHVAIYIGDGKVADNIGHIRFMSLADWVSDYPDGCWGWVSTTPVNSSYPVNPGLIHAGRGSSCY